MRLLAWRSASEDSDKLGHTRVTLDQCLQQFSTPEVLSRDNKWYCNQCKEHVQATKSLQIWKLPEVLILHLKRFEYRNILYPVKLNQNVAFPLQGLDLNTHERARATTALPAHKPSLVAPCTTCSVLSTTLGPWGKNLWEHQM